MQTVQVLFFVLTLGAVRAEQSNPLGKVIDLLNELAAKVTADGEREAKAFKEYFEWCDDAAANLKNEIKTGTARKAKLEAKIAELGSTIDTCSSAIEELAAAIQTSTGELEDATAIRKKEAADFAASEGELVDGLDTLSRAISILNREMSKNPAALAQIDNTNMKTLLRSMSTVMEAAAFSGSDKQKLLGLLQSQQGSRDSDDDLGAPAAATYKSHSGGIFDVLEDMKENVEAELSDLRKAEVNSAHNFDMLKQSLEDKIAADENSMAEEKAERSSAQENKAGAEADLGETVKDLKAANEALATASANCMTTAADHEATVTARNEELKVIAEATQILVKTSGGAVEQTYGFVQVNSMLKTGADLAGSEVVVLVKKLAKEQHSAALAQLASRIQAVARFGSTNGADPFAKIKGLISDMIAKLESEADADAEEKAFCDEMMAKTEAKKSEMEDDVNRLTTKIDQAVAKSAELKASVKELQAELAALAKTQADMDRIRAEQNADYVKAKADLELGLDGVRKALAVLRDYYGGGAAMLQSGAGLEAEMQQPAAPEQHSAATGAGQSIINILEVCESDFANNLAKEETEEADSASEYDKMTQENTITKTQKTQDVKYQTQEFNSLDKSVGDMSADRASVNTELDAVLEYYGQLKGRCIAKPETYEERKARRTAEIEGLKQALEILENETAFVQRKRRTSNLRGSLSM